MPLTQYSLDKFVAQDLSQLTECTALPIESEFPDYRSWLNSFVLTWMLKLPLPNKKAALAFALLRRAEAAITDYDAGLTDLRTLVSRDKSVSVYFRCLRKFESAIASVYQALDFASRTVGTQLFNRGEGSTYEALNVVYNKSKHADPESLPPGQLHAIWLKNEGLFAGDAQLSFADLRESILLIGRIADKLAKGTWLEEEPSNEP